MDTRPGASAVAATRIGRRGVLMAGTGAALALATLTDDAEAAAAATSGWRWCNRCQGLFRGKGARSVGVCPHPDGGAHKPVAGFNYLLLSGLSVDDPSFPKSWSQCQKCRGLFQDSAAANSVCPDGGKHVRTGPQYGVWIGGAPPFPPFMEAGWNRCGFCQGLFWDGGTSKGVCPAGGEHQGGTFNILLILLR